MNGKQNRTGMASLETNRARRRVGIATVALAALALSGCATSTQASSGGTATAHIALVVPTSGLFGRQGTLVREGAEMARDEINKQGGVHALGGAKIELDVQDAGATVESAVSAANRALAKDRPAGGIGAWVSSLTLGVTEVAERKHIPWLTVSFADAITERGFKYTHQTSPVSSVAASQGLKGFLDLAAAAGSPIKNIALVGDNTAASKGFLDAVHQKVAPALGLHVVTTQEWTPPLTDGSSIAKALASSKPDAIVYSVTSFSDSAVVLRALDQFQVKAPIIGNGSALIFPEYLKSVGADRMNGVMTIVGAHPGKGSEELVRRFTQRTKEPYMTQDALSGYYHVWLLKEAMERAKSADPEAVNKALATIDLTSGPAAKYMSGGRVRFDKTGRRIDATPLIVQWQNGKPVTVWPAAAAVASPLTTR
jgi:branched-chain amino acid transport system substrate-binding protein